MTESPPPSSMRRDVASAYLLAGCRVGSWVVVSAAVYRCMGPDAFAMLALVRATVGLLSYTSLGLAPAMVHMLAKADADHSRGEPCVRPGDEAEARRVGTTHHKPEFQAGDNAPLSPSTRPIPLSYAVPDELSEPIQKVFLNGMVLANITGACAIVLSLAYAFLFPHLHAVPSAIGGAEVFGIVLFVGLGIVARLISDVPGAVLQVHGAITLDNMLQCFGEILWAALAVFASTRFSSDMVGLGIAYFLAYVSLMLLRTSWAGQLVKFTFRNALQALDPRLMLQLLSYGSTVVLGQVAAFLFTPIAYILINRLISAEAVADYAPAVQIDAGLLLLITGLSTVLLPKSAVAHGAGDSKLVRTYYIRGTLLGTGLLALGALAVWPLAPLLFKLWLGNPMPRTQAILPWVMLHTVIGGSSAIGCSILMATGKAKPFAISALFTGVINVALGLLFVGYWHMGLKGVVFGTLIAAIFRSILWMPWYVLRSLRHTQGPVAVGIPSL